MTSVGPASSLRAGFPFVPANPAALSCVRRNPSLDGTAPHMAKPRVRTDAALLAAYRQGDTAAFAELVDRYHDDLLRFLMRLMGSRAAAEDVFQETFLQI